jgi:hypothetical protein
MVANRVQFCDIICLIKGIWFERYMNTRNAAAVCVAGAGDESAVDSARRVDRTSDAVSGGADQSVDRSGLLKQHRRGAVLEHLARPCDLLGIQRRNWVAGVVNLHVECTASV